MVESCVRSVEAVLVMVSLTEHSTKAKASSRCDHERIQSTGKDETKSMMNHDER